MDFFKNKKQQNKTKGFTFIEIVITMGVIALLSATMFQIIAVSDTQQDLTLKAGEVKTGIRLAQVYALSPPEESFDIDFCGAGVHASGSDLIVYYLYNDDYRNNPGACNNPSNFGYGSSLTKINKKIIPLDSGYSFSSAPEIFFSSPYAQVYSSGVLFSGTKNYTITSPNSQNKTIEINSQGKINLQ